MSYPIVDSQIDPSVYVNQSIEEEYRGSGLCARLYASIQSIFNAACFYLAMIPRISIFSHPDCSHPYQNKEWEWKKDSEGLFVVLHGLLGSPRFSSLKYKEVIEGEYEHKKYDVQVPYIEKKGNLPLDEAAEPILAMVQHYIQKNPGKPINLIGTSNGGRIAAYIDTKLKEQKVDVCFTGLAGVFYGSSSMDLLAKTGLASLVFHKDLVTELQTGSEKAQEVIQGLQRPAQGKRSYKFYATNGDLYIPNFSSCFPNLGRQTSHELVIGQDHVSLGVSVCREVVERHVQWMNPPNE